MEKKRRKRRNTPEDILKPEVLIRIRGWCMDGLTNEQIAENLHISVSSLCKWKKQYSELNTALKVGKDVADRQVENALFNSAIGFTDKEGTYHAPNITAIIYWLKNRKPLQWRDKVVEMDNSELTRASEILANVESVIDNADS